MDTIHALLRPRRQQRENRRGNKDVSDKLAQRVNEKKQKRHIYYDLIQDRCRASKFCVFCIRKRRTTPAWQKQFSYPNGIVDSKHFTEFCDGESHGSPKHNSIAKPHRGEIYTRKLKIYVLRQFNAKYSSTKRGGRVHVSVSTRAVRYQSGKEVILACMEVARLDILCLSRQHCRMIRKACFRMLLLFNSVYSTTN